MSHQHISTCVLLLLFNCVYFSNTFILLNYITPSKELTSFVVHTEYLHEGITTDAEYL